MLWIDRGAHLGYGAPMRSRSSIIAGIMVCLATVASSRATMLTSGQYHITQSWSQETDFRRPYLVQVPAAAAGERLPVFLFLHGNGGSAQGSMTAFIRRHPHLAARHIMVFAQGYAKSWNIVSERSQADDLAFIEAIIKVIASHDNVRPDDFAVMGNSNGAALVNQLAIECRLPNLRNFITAVSPLNVFQHDGRRFKAKGAGNEYHDAAVPPRGRRLLNISGTEDRLIPYHGGPSPVIPARDGKLAFLDAEQSTFLWAKAMGYEGARLDQPSSAEGSLEFFNYLGGDVIHCRLNGEGHGAARAVGENVLLRFLNREQNTGR